MPADEPGYIRKPAAGMANSERNTNMWIDFICVDTCKDTICRKGEISAETRGNFDPCMSSKQTLRRITEMLSGIEAVGPQ